MNDNDYVDEASFDVNTRSSIVGQGGHDKDIRTTEGEDHSYEEATNCRLREETNASMLFGPNGSAPVKLNQIKLNVQSSAKRKGNTIKQSTPAKVAPFDY